jgi:hypothetical protein
VCTPAWSASRCNNCLCSWCLVMLRQIVLAVDSAPTARRSGVRCTMLPGSTRLPLAGGRQRPSTGRGYSRVLPRYRSGHGSARLLRHRRGAARAALPCAGTYVSGDVDSNVCPVGSVRIEAEDACRTAATATGKTFRSAVSEFTSPRGCFYSILSVFAYLNTHRVGAGDANSQLLCAVGASAGAPP